MNPTDDPEQLTTQKLEDDGRESGQSARPDVEIANGFVLPDPANPSQWPKWKKNAQILLIAFHSFSATFMAAGIIPASDWFSEEFNVSVQQSTYLSSSAILVFGVAPFVWGPITSRFGRYQVLLISVTGTLVCNIGAARCTTYGGMMATRVIASFLISPPLGIGSGVVTDLSEPEHRAQKMGWWTLLLTVGTPSGPFFMGFVAEHAGVRWIFWVFTIVNFVELLAYLLIGDETVYVQDNRLNQRRSALAKIFIPRRINPKPLRVIDFVKPLSLFTSIRVLVPSWAYAVVYCYANVSLIVETPVTYGERYNFNAQEVGLQYISIIIGCLLGEQLSGPTSDWFLNSLRRKKGHSSAADRLWLSYIGYATVFTGLLVWGFELQAAKKKWDVSPDIGSAIASFGNQVLTTILVTFAVDSRKDRSTEVGVFVNAFRQIYGFVGPFYLPQMFDKVGFGNASGIMCGIIAGAALIPTIIIQITSSGRRA